MRERDVAHKNKDIITYHRLRNKVQYLIRTIKKDHIEKLIANETDIANIQNVLCINTMVVIRNPNKHNIYTTAGSTHDHLEMAVFHPTSSYGTLRTRGRGEKKDNEIVYENSATFHFVYEDNRLALTVIKKTL